MPHVNPNVDVQRFDFALADAERAIKKARVIAKRGAEVEGGQAGLIGRILALMSTVETSILIVQARARGAVLEEEGSPEAAHEEGLENPPPTTVQTVVFDKAHWGPGKARAWLREHNFKFGKVDVKENTLRFRQRAPGDFKGEDFRTIRFGEPAIGIQAVIGHLK